MQLTVGYITARNQPHFEWFLESLANQMKPDDEIEVILVDGIYKQRYIDIPKTSAGDDLTVRHVAVMPNIWQGRHRIRKQDNWAASAARNTAICLCQTDWIAFCDDRCVLTKNWLNGIRGAQHYGYVVAGSYEKRIHMQVKEGKITHQGTVAGKDTRVADKSPMKAPGNWLFGCTLALPLQWALSVNGYDTTCDGIGAEDCFFGMMLENSGYPIFYESRMQIIEDRTPGECSPIMYRTDKGVSPNDKSHAMVEKLRALRQSLHIPVHYDLREIRDTLKAKGKFPVPEKKQYRDWYDDSLINEI